MAKFYECTTSARGDGDELDHSTSMGVQISNLCAKPLVKYGVEALEECKNHRPGKALEEVILGIIVSTGFVSNLVGIDLKYGPCTCMLIMDLPFADLPKNMDICMARSLLIVS